MTNPFKNKKLLVLVDGNVIGVVEGMDVKMMKEGGIEFHYGSETGRHSIGTKHATFRIRRWMYIDAKKKLLFDLFDNSTPFSLAIGITDNGTPTPDFVSGTKVLLSDCVGYSWGPVTGATNDTTAEELVGEAVTWDASLFED